MLPVCSAIPSCSSDSQITFHGGLQSIFGRRKPSEIQYLVNSNAVASSFNGKYFYEIPYKSRLVKSMQSGQIDSVVVIHSSSFSNVSNSSQCTYAHSWNSSIQTVSDLETVRVGYLNHIGDLAASKSEEGSIKLLDELTESINRIPVAVNPGDVSRFDNVQDIPFPSSESLTVDSGSFSNLKGNLDNISSELNKQVKTPNIDFVPDDSVSLFDSSRMVKDSVSSLLNGESSTMSVNETIVTSVDTEKSNITRSLDTVTSSLKGTLTNANDPVDNAVSQFSSTVDQTLELAGSQLESFWGDLKQASGKAGVVAVDLLRHTIIAVEDSLSGGVSLVVYSYGSAKELLPLEIRDVLSLFEETATKIFVPVGAALRQVSYAVVELERLLGLDPDDPIVPFVIFLGTSTTLWFFYQRQIYGGYAGDLSPKETLELLKGKENAVLVDVRPEELRERDGIPDIRRSARFRYASVDVPEFDSSVKKLLKSGRDLDDTLIAAVIRNLKIVQGRSKVVIMDANGSRSKGIARSLRKLGIKGSYLMEGGFGSWVKQGLRVKEPRPETTLTILNEEAEAILEEFNPTPVRVLGFSLGLLAASCALLEWEKTLQLIGLVGIGLTLYWRVSTYNDAEDLKKDVRLLVAPVRFGAAALSWASGKIETNGLGLPTSPSSSDVQNRVLKAVAKHESQPAEPEDLQDLASSTSPPAEDIDL